MTTFHKGHALIIGVGQYHYHPEYNVPITQRDAAVMKETLLGAACAYPPQQVAHLAGQMATKDHILTALDTLANKAQPDETILIYYAGHGDYDAQGTYHLTTHDTQLEKKKIIPGTGVSEEDLRDKLRALKVSRLLLLINACHAGSFTSTLDNEPPSSFFGTRLPSESTTQALLSTGEGRLIMAACRESQKSYFVQDGQALTFFTQALVTGLRGQGGVRNNGGYIGAYDLYLAVYQNVRQTAQRMFQVMQEPVLTVQQGVGPFPVALYQGGHSLGVYAPEPLPKGTTAAREITINIEGHNVAQHSGIGDIHQDNRQFNIGSISVTNGDMVMGDKHVYQGKSSGQHARFSLKKFIQFLEQTDSFLLETLAEDEKMVIQTDLEILLHLCQKESPNFRMIRSRFQSILAQLEATFPSTERESLLTHAKRFLAQLDRQIQGV